MASVPLSLSISLPISLSSFLSLHTTVMQFNLMINRFHCWQQSVAWEKCHIEIISICVFQWQLTISVATIIMIAWLPANCDYTIHILLCVVFCFYFSTFCMCLSYQRMPKHKFPCDYLTPILTS